MANYISLTREPSNEDRALIASLPLTGQKNWDNYMVSQIKAGRPREDVLREASVGASADADWWNTHYKDPGLLDKIVGMIGPAAGFLTGNPALGAFLGGAFGSHGRGPGSAILGGISGFAAGGGFKPITGAIKNALTPGGFSNPSGLGLSGNNLNLPGLANAPGASPVTGYGASGLGLKGVNLGINLGSAAFPSAPVQGYGASAVGGNPASLYNPQSLGGPKPPNQLANAAKNALGSLSGGPAAPQQQAGGGRSPAAFAIPPMASGGGNVVTDRFNYALTDALTGKQPQNSLAMTGMGAGLIAPTQRDMVRNPGYQPRPFANYLMRA